MISGLQKRPSPALFLKSPGPAGTTLRRSRRAAISRKTGERPLNDHSGAIQGPPRRMIIQDD